MQYFLFIRAVNVGKRKMPSANLKSMLEDIGFDNVGVFLASGNACFECRKQSTDKIAERIETAIESSFGYSAECFVYPRETVEKLSTANPFKLSQEEISKYIVNVTLFRKPLSPSQFKEIAALSGDYDAFAKKDATLFWLCRGKKMTDSPIAEKLTKLLPKPNTTRKIDTFQRILDKFPG